MFAPIGRAAQLLENRKSQSGTWITAAMEAFIPRRNVNLYVAALSQNETEIRDSKAGVTYIGVSQVHQTFGSLPKREEIECWEKIINRTKPDIIMIWGTECSNGLAIIEAAQGIPVLFYIQGVIGRNSLYSIGLLSYREMRKYINILSILKFEYLKKNERMQRRNLTIEKMMVEKSAGLIMDNEWEKSYYRLAYSPVKIYHWPLPIQKHFLNDHYDVSRCEKHRIFSIDGRYPGKGVHQLIQAVARVKHKYPDVKLVIPGRMPNRKPEFIFESPYFTYLKALIEKENLQNNVSFCGQITSMDIKCELMKCNVFVMPSCYESQSAALREAMYLGVPVVSSNVGPVDEYTKYGEDALTYRYGEIDSLVDCILKVFDSDQLATSLGNNAYDNIREHFPQNSIGEELENIYWDVLNEHNS